MPHFSGTSGPVPRPGCMCGVCRTARVASALLAASEETGAFMGKDMDKLRAQRIEVAIRFALKQLNLNVNGRPLEELISLTEFIRISEAALAATKEWCKE